MIVLSCVSLLPTARLAAQTTAPATQPASKANRQAEKLRLTDKVSRLLKAKQLY